MNSPVVCLFVEIPMKESIWILIFLMLYLIMHATFYILKGKRNIVSTLKLADQIVWLDMYNCTTYQWKMDTNDNTGFFKIEMWKPIAYNWNQTLMDTIH